jgi:flagellar motor switch protein FliN/FliY
VELPELGSAPRGQPLVLRSLDAIRDVQVKATAVLGTASLSIESLFALKEGEMIELDQAVDAPVELLIEGRLVAHGQIVVVGDQFGLLIKSVAES